MKRICILIFSLWGVLFPSQAQEALDSIECSLITCSPGDEVYSLYGHTAIRCRNFTRNLDLVFNYGVFSFRQPHFIWRFVKGECDYMVDAMPWEYFPQDYERRGSSITAQILNLSQEESNHLFQSLLLNCQKENREYRYNFLYNNCTTKVRDKIESSINGTVEYLQGEEKKTYRQIIHEYTEHSPWAQEGNDFLLGAAVDTLLTDRASMFAPNYLMEFVANASIRRENGDVFPLVLRTESILQESPHVPRVSFPLSPLEVALLFLFLNVLILLLEYWTRHIFWLWDLLVMFVQGCTGLLLLFMFLFSEHPAVNSNWLLWIINPLPFLGIYFVLKSVFRHKRTLWHPFNFAILSLFIIFFAWIPQNFGNIVVPLTLALLTRPVSYHLFYQRRHI